jgi:hypothetical protein
MPVHPASQALPHRWRWSNLLPMAEQAGRLVPVGRGGERRAIALANPGLGGRPLATPTLWAAIQYLNPHEDTPVHRQRVRTNKGARTAGVDGQTAPYIRVLRGEEPFLAELRANVKAGVFAPFRAAGAEVRGVSTQRPDQLRAFAGHARLPYPLLSDEDGRLAAGLLLPTSGPAAWTASSGSPCWSGRTRWCARCSSRSPTRPAR